MKSIFLSSLLLLVGASLFAQQELGLHFMTDMLQSQATQPAYFSPKKMVISLPSSTYSFSNSGFVLADILSKSRNSLVINGNPTLEKMRAENYIRANVTLSPIAFALRVKDFQVGFSTAFKTNVYANYSQEMIGLLFQGNGQYVGKTVDMGVDLAANAYSEMAATVAYRVPSNKRNKESNCTIGAKFAYLNGWANLSTSPNRKQATLHTDKEIYALTLKTDYELQSSMVMEGDIMQGKLGTSSPRLFGQNHGWAMDLGATYNLNPKWKVSASVIDIGKIHWVENAKSYRSKGTYNHKGLSFDELLNGGGNTDFQSLPDTLKKIFQFKETQTTGYSTTLPTQFYLSMTYQPFSFIHFGGLVYGEWYRQKLNPAIALSSNFNWKYFSFGVLSSYRNGRFGNLGLNAALKYHALQMYVATDHLIGALAPQTTRNSNLKAGVNLAF
ncbi:MAG: DUF5723 family protein [Bacteroidia bacterium]